MAALLGLVVPAVLSAQSIEGGMSVSLRIVEPVGTVPFTAAVMTTRGGVTTLGTSAPVTGPTSQIVMVQLATQRGAAFPASVVLRTASGDRAVGAVAIPVGADGTLPAMRGPDGHRLSYRLRLDAPVGASGVTQLRLSYLAVAGT